MERQKIPEWSLTQHLGESVKDEDGLIANEDEEFLISKLQYFGDNLYLADKGGRVIVFKRFKGKYEYLLEFDNDTCNSEEEEKEKSNNSNSNSSSCVENYIQNFEVISSNNCSSEMLIAEPDGIKFKRIMHKTLEDCGSFTAVKTVQLYEDNTNNINNAYDYENVHSLQYDSFNKNIFISCDSKFIKLWNLEYSNGSCNNNGNNGNNGNSNKIISKFDLSEKDEKITKMTVRQNIVSSVLFGTDKGSSKLLDMRVGNKCVVTCPTIFEETDCPFNSSTINTKAIHDLCFLPCDEWMFVTRDFLSLNLWDLRKPSELAQKVFVYEPMLSSLGDYNMFDYNIYKFNVAPSSFKAEVVTGGYDSAIHVVDFKKNLNNMLNLDCEEKETDTFDLGFKLNSKKKYIDLSNSISQVAHSQTRSEIAMANVNCVDVFKRRVKN